ncbi:hypothetical protein BKA62DRAFT_792038 [Auriculariales sp. MPI-PUGE-AT-0066]|nr:hypothetical protein BKA62DRAFT_792038 [Auriculariales sp. MPI-PUGE-AT-0066]
MRDSSPLRDVEAEADSVPLLEPGTPIDGADHAKTIVAQEERSEARRGDLLGTALVLVGISTMVLTVWIKIWSVGWATLNEFALHPTFNVLGISIISLGILTLQPSKHPRTKVAGLWRHQRIMLGLAVPCLIIGTAAIIIYKAHRGSAHFKSLHAVTSGTLCSLLARDPVILGAGSVWFNGRLFSKDKEHAKAVWKWHRASGYLLFLLFQVVIWAGVQYTHFFHEHASAVTRIVFFNLAPLLVVVGIWSRSRLSKMPLLGPNRWPASNH